MGFDAAEGRGVLWEIEETRREEKRRAPENAGGGSCFRGIKRMWWAMVFGSLDFSESRRPKPLSLDFRKVIIYNFPNVTMLINKKDHFED